MVQSIREDGVVGGTPRNHRGSGGSIPASSLFYNGMVTDDAACLVMKYHYSRRMPSNIQYVGAFNLAGGLFGGRGECVAAVIYTIPGTRWTEEVWELSRLVRKDGIRVPLTKLISMSCTKIRKAGKIDLLVSFADWTQRHLGTVYKASGWHYAGKRERRMDGLTVDGVYVGGRACNHAWGTRSPSKLASILPRSTIIPHFDEGKHLYWKALSPSGDAKAARLGLEKMPYPVGPDCRLDCTAEISVPHRPPTTPAAPQETASMPLTAPEQGSYLSKRLKDCPADGAIPTNSGATELHEKQGAQATGVDCVLDCSDGSEVAR